MDKQVKLMKLIETKEIEIANAKRVTEKFEKQSELFGILQAYLIFLEE